MDSEVLAENLKNTIPSLISSNQTADLNDRFISRGCLVPDIFEESNFLKLKGLLLTFDTEKAFDSVNHDFLLKVLQSYSFSQDFLKWISIFLQNRDLCVINGG